MPGLFFVARAFSTPESTSRPVQYLAIAGYGAARTRRAMTPRYWQPTRARPQNETRAGSTDIGAYAATASK